MKQKKNWQWSILSMLLICCIILPLKATETPERIRILFTHDLHDAFTPVKVRTDEGIGERGGYARLMTAIEKEKADGIPTLLVDAGDYSMGTLFQSLFEELASELAIMGKMGYEVVTLGNHEFDFRAQGLANHLNTAVEKGGALPQLVASNIEVPEENAFLQQAMDNYGVNNYTILEKDGIKIGIFGLMGKEADTNAPMAGVTFLDQETVAQEMGGILKAEGADLIVCLSHSGTHAKEKHSEDERLAKKVPEIDVIISGHSHTVLEDAIQVGDTYIGSSGTSAANLGVMELDRDATGSWQLVDRKSGV